VGSAEGLVRRMVMLTTFILDDDNNILLSDRVGGVGCCVVERAGKVGWFRREQGRAPEHTSLSNFLAFAGLWGHALALSTVFDYCRC